MYAYYTDLISLVKIHRQIENT